MSNPCGRVFGESMSRWPATLSPEGGGEWPASYTADREDAEIALGRLEVADHEKRLPRGGTNARSVRAAFQLYLQSVDSGLIEPRHAHGYRALSSQHHVGHGAPGRKDVRGRPAVPPHLA